MIIAAGLTPAWQQILIIKGLRIGEVNRASEAQWCASGKVLNAGLALHYLGAQSTTFAPIGGFSGRSIDQDFARQGITRQWLWSENPTRVCTTLLDPVSGSTTELVENAAPLAIHELEAFNRTYQSVVQGAGMAVLSGSLPGGTPPTFYRELIQCTPCRVILDARGPELLEALACRPFLVKPNREELGRTLGRDLNSEPALIDAIAEVNSLGAEWVVVSQGARALYLGGQGELRRFQPPKVSAVNPIASGDCLAAGIASAVDAGFDIVQAVRIGMGAAAQNASMLLPARLDPETVRQLAAKVVEIHD